MKANIRRLLSMLLVLAMVLSMVPAVMAEDEITEVDTSSELVDAMANGGNIKLTAGFELEEKATVPADKTVTLDLANYQITSDNGNTKYIENLGTLTIKASGENGGISTGTGTSGQSTRAIRNTGTLTIEGGSFVSESSGNTYTVFSDGGPVTISGGSFTAKYTGTGNYHAAGLGLKNATAQISGNPVFIGSSKSTDSGSRVAAILVTANGATADITIEGGSFTGQRIDSDQVASAVGGVGTVSATLTICGGSFAAEGTNKELLAAGTGTVTITGGTFSDDVSSYLGDDYEWDDATGAVGLKGNSGSNPEDNGIDTTEELQAAVNAGGEVTLGDGFALDAKITIPAGVTVTLDLNGKTITSDNGHTKRIENAGNLTIVNAGETGGITVTSTSDNNQSVYVIYNTGTLTIDGGNFTANSSNSAACVVYSEAPSVTINGGEFTANYTIDGYYSAHALALAGDASGSAVAIINGGKFTTTSKSTKDAKCAPLQVRGSNKIDVIVNDGTFEGYKEKGAYGASVMRAGCAASTVTINGGEFSAKISGSDRLFTGTQGTLTITGGTFKYDGTIFTKNPVSLTGGTFLKQDGTKNDIGTSLAEGYTQLENGAVVRFESVNNFEAFRNALENGSNVKVTNIIELTEKVEIPADKTVILDLNGQTITSNDGANFYIYNRGKLTIEDSSADGTGAIVSNSKSGSGSNILCVSNDGDLQTKEEEASSVAELTINGGSFTVNSGNRSCYTVFSKGKSVVINGGTFAANYTPATSAYVCHTLGLGGTDSTVAINGGKFTATSGTNHTGTRCAPIYVLKESNVQITIEEGTEFSGKRTVGTNGASALRIGDSATSVITINGGTFSAENAGTDGFINGLKGTVNINGGTFKYDGAIFTTKPTSVTGGTFLKQDGTKNDINTSLAEGYTQLENGAVVRFESVDNFEAFCNALENGSNVKVTNIIELTEKVDIPADKTVILDLNGQTITSDNGEEHHISNAGYLTIIDSGENGTVSVTSANKAANVICINNDGELVIEDGTFTVTSDNRTAYAVFSKGESLVINGGTFTASYTKATGAYQAQTLGLGGTGSSVTINGGTFTAESDSERTDSRCATMYVLSDSTAQVTVNGGTFTATRTVGINGASVLRNESSAAAAKVTINGGIFTASAGTDCMMDATAGQLEITGGTFTYDGNVFAEERGSVTGGKFTNSNGKLNDVTARVATGYVQLEDGSVVPATDLPNVITVGDKAYKTVWEAMSKSTSGQTVTLVADAKTEETVSVPEGVILDLGGHKLEAAGVFGDAGQIIDSTQAGLLQIPADFAAFNPDNSQLPIWDAEADGYRLAKTKIRVKTGDTGVFRFRFDLTNAAWEALLPANNISLLVRVDVDNYTQTYMADQSCLEALYADPSGSGAIIVTFTDAPEQMDIQVSVKSKEVEVSKATERTVLTPVSPSSEVDPLATDVRKYLAEASALYDNATVEQLLGMTSPKLAGQSLNDSKQPITLSWKWDESIPADSQFTIELSQTEDFAQTQVLECDHFNENVSVQSEPFWNPLMDTTYYWRVVAKLTDGSTVTGETMSFTTEAGFRMIRLSGGWNTRDLGGWDTGAIELSDGTSLPAGKTTQGLVFRSARLQSLTEEGKATVLNELGIKTEIDLRDPNGSDKAVTCFTDGELKYVTGPTTANAYGSFITYPEVAYTYLIEFTKPENYPIIFHCAIGADRTGSLAFILNALQGVSIADLVKDYEITTDRFVQGLGSNTNFPALLEEFNKLEGATPYEKARTFCTNAGLTDTQIDTIIRLMRGL